MKNIDHVVYLMLENRSLDNVLGWLYENDNPLHVIPKESNPVYNGLQTGKYSIQFLAEDLFRSQKSHHPGNQNIPTVDPNEPFANVTNQVFGIPHQPSANMSGFFADFLSVEPKNPKQIMACYTPTGLPVINFLAKTFAVSDAYYSSLPTQTNCNRAFSITGNSVGTLPHASKNPTAMVDNYWTWDYEPQEFSLRTIWDAIDNDNAWTVFYNELWLEDYCFTLDIFWPTMKHKKHKFQKIHNFFELAKKGQLPKFSYLEPAWYFEEDGIGWNGNDYHPPANLAPGERFLYQIYQLLLNSPKWNNTLLIINFDEHGGTYDHVPPPAATAPWEGKGAIAKPPNLQYGFDFHRYGVRVPLILVSPLIPAGTVFRSSISIPFDHSSVIATILNHLGVPPGNWQLGSRVANAPTFGDVVSLTTPRTNIPPCPNPGSPGEQSEEDVQPNDLQYMIANRMLIRKAQELNYPLDKFKNLADEHFKQVKKMSELREAVRGMVQRMNGSD
jgi:phospholipase C